jgi:hypothetical protein
MTSKTRHPDISTTRHPDTPPSTMHTRQVKCENNIAGVMLPSEGYHRWGFGWKFAPELQLQTEGLTRELESKAPL